MNDLDYTGYGPTSAGRAPSAAELRRAAYNRQHTSRAIQAMQYIDPVAIAASERMVRLGMGEDKSPQAVRRALHSTAAGQATLDAAFAARSAGLLGYGDPRQYSANITQMLSGGFTQDVSGGALDTQAYRTQGFGQRVTGNGVIAERAAIVMQKQMLDDLYGEDGLADPSRLNGYDMTEASQVAARVVGRRGMGKMMHLQKNADIGTRIGAALQAEVDPNVRAGLESLTDEQKDKLANAERSGDSGKFDKAVAEISASLDDPKAREAFQNIAKSKDAMVFNEKNAKKLHDTVREVTKGMAALNDIYGDLSSDDAHAMLEQIHGGRITNKQQARAAARTVDNMRNAAEYAGMDPKQLMGLFAGVQQTLAQQLSKQLNLDERDEGAGEETAAKLAAKFAPEAAVASKNIAEARAALGLPGEGRSPKEIAADNARMQMEANEIYGGFIYSQGEMSGLNDSQKAEMLREAEVFKQYQAQGDTDNMYATSQRMKKIVSDDFDTAIKQGAAKSDMLSGQVAAADAIRDATRMPIAKDFALTNRLGELTINREAEDTLYKVGGVATLNKLAEIEKIKPTEERIAEIGPEKAEEEARVERAKQREKILVESGASEQERAKAMQTIFDKDGKMKEHFSVAAEVAKRDPEDIEFVKKVGGAKTLSRLSKLEDIQPTAERIEEIGPEKAEEEARAERDKQRDQILAESGLSERDRTKAIAEMYDEDGSMKDEFKNYKEAAVFDKDKTRKFNEFILNKMGGVVGLGKLAQAAEVKPLDAERVELVGVKQAEKEAREERERAVNREFDLGEATDEERALAKEILFNRDGSFKDEAKKYGDVLEKSDYSAAQNTRYVKNVNAEQRLRNLEKNDKRQRMTDKDNKISIRGVAQSMLRGEVKNPLTDADTAGAALDALQSSGVPLMVQEEEEYLKEDGTVGTRKVDRNLAEKYVSGIKLNNLDDEALTKIDKVAGKEVNLVDRVNKKLGTNMTREEFIKKSRTDKKLQDAAFTELADAGDELGFKTGGARDNISVVSDDVGRLGGKFTDRFNKLKTLESVSGFVGDEEMSKLTNDVLQGREPKLGDMIEADEYDRKDLFEGKHDKVKTKDGKGYAAKLENSGRFQAIADIANSGDKKQTADVAAMLGDKGIEAFEQQIKAMEDALASGDIDPVNGKMVDDKGVERELNEKTINEMKAALAELRQTADESNENGAQKIGVMTVTKLEVTGGFYNKKE